MHTSRDSLVAGYGEWAEKHKGTSTDKEKDVFNDLVFLVGWIIEGSASEKREARKAFAKLIGRGRCILNALEIDKKCPADLRPTLIILTKGQR